MFQQEIFKYSINLLEAAVNLRSALMFRECIIYIAGCWNGRLRHRVDDPKLHKIIQHARANICEKIAMGQESTMNALVSGEEG